MGTIAGINKANVHWQSAAPGTCARCVHLKFDSRSRPVCSASCFFTRLSATCKLFVDKKDQPPTECSNCGANGSVQGTPPRCGECRATFEAFWKETEPPAELPGNDLAVLSAWLQYEFARSRVARRPA
jgi:hypothetical protein